MENNSVKKIISIICILGIVILLFTYFHEIYRTRDYIKTNAVITSNIENIDYGEIDNSQTTKYKYVEVKYDNYINKYRVWTFLFNKEGTTTTVFYSKENPKLIRDKFKMTTALLGIVFLSIFAIGINVSKVNSSTVNVNTKKSKIRS